MNTAAEVQRHLRQTGVVSVNVQTIRRTLKSVGLRSGLKRKVPHLTPRHRKLRYEWAKAHKNWSINQWRKVIWSDETKINLFGSDGHRWCWKNRGKGLESRVISQTRKYGGGNIMVWGCMTAQGAGFATRIIGNMDAALYQDILKGELVQTLDWYDLERDHVIFQHDNDPKHTAHSTTELLSTQNWAVLDWPPQSPDMNPIEHLWKHVKNELYLDSEMPTNKDDLWVKVERIWDSIDPAVCLNLIDSMPRRVEALLKARGGHTKY